MLIFNHTITSGKPTIAPPQDVLMSIYILQWESTQKGNANVSVTNAVAATHNLSPLLSSYDLANLYTTYRH